MFNLDKIVMYFAYLLLENNLNLVIIFCCGIMIKNDVFINPSCLIYAKLFVISGHHSVYIGHLSFLDTMYIYVKEIAFFICFMHKDKLQNVRVPPLFCSWPYLHCVAGTWWVFIRYHRMSTSSTLRERWRAVT